MRTECAYASMLYHPFNKKELSEEDLDEMIEYEGIELVPIKKETLKKELGDNYSENCFYSYLCYGDNDNRSLVPRIFYNANLSSDKIFFLKAHELAHHLMHEKMSFLPFDPSKENDETKQDINTFRGLVELEASLFANHILFPEAELRLIFGEDLATALNKKEYKEVNSITQRIEEFLKDKLPERSKGDIDIRLKTKIHNSIRALRFKQIIEEELTLYSLMTNYDKETNDTKPKIDLEKFHSNNVYKQYLDTLEKNK